MILIKKKKSVKSSSLCPSWYGFPRYGYAVTVSSRDCSNPSKAE